VVTFANNDPAAAFVITGPNGTVTPTVDLSLSTPQQTVVRLTFSGNGTQWGSLMDGNYTARVVAANISTGGINMAADHVTNFHRLFGDVNGDKQVDGFDFSAFSGAYNTTTGNPAYRASLDVNGDGVIDGFDFSHFSGRYGTMLP
jgi:hypothetical protein